MLVKIDEFDPMSLGFDKVNVSSSTSVIIPKVYDGEPCPMLQLPWVKMSCYGIPKKSKYFPTDKDRQFMHIPLQGELLEQFKAIDRIMSTDEIKTEIFGFNIGQTMELCPLVKNGNKGEYVKIKLDTDYETGNIKTKMLVNGEVATDVSTLPLFEYQLPYSSNIAMIIKLVKVWTMNKRFGLTIKAIKVSVKQPEQPKETEVDFLD